jgi:hypothetical protein
MWSFFSPLCLFSGHELLNIMADSLHRSGDFALFVCQDAMQAMNVTSIYQIENNPWITISSFNCLNWLPAGGRY